MVLHFEATQSEAPAMKDSSLGRWPVRHADLGGSTSTG